MYKQANIVNEYVIQGCALAVPGRLNRLPSLGNKKNIPSRPAG